MRQTIAIALAIAVPLVAPAAEHGVIADIPVNEWTEMAAGKTLTYTIGGELWAFERYHSGSNRVTLKFYDGKCLNGYWEYSKPFYCFYWQGEGKSCFRHARLDSEILILETQDGIETGASQIMEGVTDEPVDCGPAGIS